MRYTSFSCLRALFGGLALLTTLTAWSAVKYVKTNGSDSNNGNSWATAYQTAQKAFDAAAAGDTVCFAAGSYSPTVIPAFLFTDQNNRRTIFINKDVKAFGGFPATGNPGFADRNPAVHVTTFNGNGQVQHVLWIRQLPASSIIDGFTIRGGSASFSDQVEGGSGGGIYNESSINGTDKPSHPMISNCIFTSNVAYRGGAIFNDAFGFGGASPTILNCTFINNSALVMGGAIYNEGRFGAAAASPTITNCLFSRNSSESGGAITNMGAGGGISNPTLNNCRFEFNTGKFGAAIYNFGKGGDASPVFNDCVFDGNSDAHRFGTGGAMIADGQLGGQSNLIMRRCRFLNNSAAAGGAVDVTAAHDGYCRVLAEDCVFSGNSTYIDNSGMWFNDAADNGRISTTFINCGMFNNRAPNRGGLFMGLNIQRDTIHLVNCTIVGNRSNQGIIYHNPFGSATNCIFWGNSPLFGVNNPNFRISHSLLQGSACPPQVSCGVGVLFNVDPLFADTSAGNFHLLPGSPAFNAGTDTGASDHDFEGNARPQYGRVDMGYDEAFLPCPSSSTIFVKATAGSGGNGTTWQSALQDLGLAIELANQCPNVTAIWVAEGEYQPLAKRGGSTERHRSFNIRRDIQLLGGFAGHETDPAQRDGHHPTVLSGELGDPDDPSDNVYHVLYLDHLSPAMLLDGLSISDGNADGNGANGENLGGGIFNDGSGAGGNGSPVIANCAFFNNRAGRDGGAFYNNGGGGGQAAPEIRDCTFADNNAALQGGAFFSQNNNGAAAPVIHHCRFLNNGSTSVGGAVCINGTFGVAQPTFTACEFSGNSAAFHGGAVFIYGNQTGTLSPLFENCLFFDNSTAQKGGAIAYDDGAAGTLTIRHCTFSGNAAASGGVLGIVHWDNGRAPIQMENCIAFANSSTFGRDNGAGDLHLQHSLIDEATCPPGAVCDAGMLYGINPLFVDPINGNLHLLGCSPAINAGAGTTSTDLEGHVRPFEGVPDLGCYELQQNATPTGADAGPDQPDACIHTGAQLHATASNGIGTWSVVDGPSQSVAQFSQLHDPNALFTPAGGLGPYVLRWTVEQEPCTSASDEVELVFGVCQITFSGRVKWGRVNTSGVKDVSVTLSGDQTANVITPVNGQYAMTVFPGAHFVITPSKNLNKMNGVNAADVARIQQHLNGNLITNPYDLIAADINGNNVISALDANILQLALLGNSAALSQMTSSWRFVPANHVLNNPPWGFPEQITLDGVSANQANLDFYGIKTGDVTAIFANPANHTAPLRLRAQDQMLHAGDTLEMAIQTGAFADLMALQLALRFDPEQLELIGAEGQGGLLLTDEHLSRETAGVLRLVWAAAKGHSLREDADFLQLRFRVMEGGAYLRDLLFLDEAVLPAVAYDSRFAEAPVQLEYSSVTALADPVALQMPPLSLECQPNPFTTRATIRFEMPQAGWATLRFTTAEGRVLAVEQHQYPAGWQEAYLELPGYSGVLYCDLATAYGTAHKTLLLLKE